MALYAQYVENYFFYEYSKDRFLQRLQVQQHVNILQRQLQFDITDTHLQPIHVGQDVGVAEGLHAFEGCLGELRLLVGSLGDLVHEHGHWLSIRLETQEHSRGYDNGT